MRNKYLAGAAKLLLPLLFWGGLLWLSALLLDKPLLLPTVPAIGKALLALLGRGSFWLALAASLGRVLAGLGIGVVLGALFGALIHLLPAAALLIRPLLTVVRSTPVASFVILVWSFTGSRILPLVIAALMVLPLVADELATGLAGADPALGEVAALYRLSPLRRFLVYRLPAALPYLFGALISSVGFAWKAGIAAEILTNTAGSLGRGIYTAKLHLETPELWAWTLTVILLSLLLEFFVKKTLRFVERRAT
ncbi:MAG: ABC transporter permease subunit [Clostridia bacterium]|nr:ABC transporter permease subunit [Clostridia bacterium]